MTIADRVKLRREQLNMSQESLAKRMGLKSRSSITRIEKAGDDISMKDVERLAEALDCSKLFLMGWLEEEQNIKAIEKVTAISEEMNEFFEAFQTLDENQKILIRNLMKTFSSKQ